MSDTERKYRSLAERQGEPPSRSSRDARLPGGSVSSGSIEVRGEVSERTSKIELSEEQLSQLAMQLTTALRPPPVEERERLYVGEILAIWFAVVSLKRVAPGNEERLMRHLMPLYLEDESSLTAARIEDHLDSLKRGGLAPSTVNKVRGVGRMAIDHAAAEKKWLSPNPFALVRRMREVRRNYEMLNLEELGKVQLRLSIERRREFRVALHLGLRTGELFALRKEDVDFDRGIITIRRSHGRDSTKTGAERVIPLLAAVAGDLLDARQASKTELVFGGANGARQRHDTKMTRILHTAMGKAGVGLISVQYKCRTRDCSEPSFGAPPIQRVDCDKCKRALWPVPEVKAVRWYDLRHMCATFHHQAGADPLAISILLGHSIKGTTQRIYTHLDDGALRRELSRWELASPSSSLLTAAQRFR